MNNVNFIGDTHVKTPTRFGFTCKPQSVKSVSSGILGFKPSQGLVPLKKRTRPLSVSETRCII